MKYRKGNLNFTLALLIAVTVGCKTSPVDAYAKLKQKTPGQGIDVLSFENLKLDSMYISRLRATDPVMTYGDSTTVYSYHKNYTVALEAGKKYKVSANGLCDCLGFRKQVIVPVIRVSDPGGNWIQVGRDKEQTKVDYNHVPYAFNTVYTFQSNRSGYYKIMLFALNSESGIEIEKLLPGIYLKSTTTGKFHLKIEEIKS